MRRQEEFHIDKKGREIGGLWDEFIIGDLRDISVVDNAITHPQMFNEVYQLAADMGGAGFIFT